MLTALHHHLRCCALDNPYLCVKHVYGAAGELVLLEEFRDLYLKPYILSNAQFKEECKVSFDHTSPAPGGESVGGSAVQGL